MVDMRAGEGNAGDGEPSSDAGGTYDGAVEAEVAVVQTLQHAMQLLCFPIYVATLRELLR